MMTNLPFEEKVTRPMPDTAKYRSDLPLTQRLALAEDLTHEMAQNGINNMLKLFRDLLPSMVGVQKPQHATKAGH